MLLLIAVFSRLVMNELVLWMVLKRCILLICHCVFTADYIGERRSGINQSVTQDVASVFKGKTLQQLSILQKSIQDKLKGGEGVDVGK